MTMPLRIANLASFPLYLGTDPSEAPTHIKSMPASASLIYRNRLRWGRFVLLNQPCCCGRVAVADHLC